MKINKKICLKFMRIQFLKIKIHPWAICKESAKKLNSKIISVKKLKEIYVKMDHKDFKVITFKMITINKFQKEVIR